MSLNFHRFVISCVGWFTLRADQGVGLNPGHDTFVLDQDTFSCFSSPRGKWVSVRAEMVLVIDLAWCVGSTGCILPRELRWFKE